MAEPATPLAYPSDQLASATEPLPRCCPSHSDWATLSQHLLLEFSDLGLEDVLAEVRRAKDAVEHVSLGTSESLQIGELIVRHQLLMRSGQRAEVARLDPERHVRAGDLD